MKIVILYFYDAFLEINKQNYCPIIIFNKDIQINNMALLTKVMVNIFLLFSMTFTIKQKLTFHLNHPIHQNIPNRHQLNTIRHQKTVIHHDMRVFSHQQGGNLMHDTVSSQNYNLNQMGFFFSLNLTVGGLPYSLNIDTGSSDLFIKGQQSQGVPQVKYQCPVCLINNKRVEIGYLDGYLQTYKANLEVQLGQHKFNQSVLVAYTAPINFEQSQGLLGLSFPQLARNRDPTFIQTLINNNITSRYAFGVNLNFQQQNRSLISFGQPDKDKYEGQIKMYQIHGLAYIISVKGVSMGDGDLLKIKRAILDTGNTCISIPRIYQTNILSAFNTLGDNKNLCAFQVQPYATSFSLLRCVVRDYNTLPILKIHIDNQTYEIDHNVYMQNIYPGQNGQPDRCDTYIQSVQGNQQLFLGDGFFNRYYAYFDIDNKKIGLAKNKQVLSYQYMYKDDSNLGDQDTNFYTNLISQ